MSRALPIVPRRLPANLTGVAASTLAGDETEICQMRGGACQTRICGDKLYVPETGERDVERVADRERIGELVSGWQEHGQRDALDRQRH